MLLVYFSTHLVLCVPNVCMPQNSAFFEAITGTLLPGRCHAQTHRIHTHTALRTPSKCDSRTWHATRNVIGWRWFHAGKFGKWPHRGCEREEVFENGRLSGCTRNDDSRGLLIHVLLIRRIFHPFETTKNCVDHSILSHVN